MTESNRLKPCPFCGNSVTSFRSSYNVQKDMYIIFVKCEVCHARSGYTFTKENPALNNYTNPAALRCQTFWNTRPFERADPDPYFTSEDGAQIDGEQAAPGEQIGTVEAPNEG